MYLNSNLNPSFIRTDFKFALINALKIVFPNTLISSCHFTLLKLLKKGLNNSKLNNYTKLMKFFVNMLPFFYPMLFKHSPYFFNYRLLMLQIDFYKLLGPIKKHFYEYIVSLEHRRYSIYL